MQAATNSVGCVSKIVGCVSKIVGCVSKIVGCVSSIVGCVLSIADMANFVLVVNTTNPDTNTAKLCVAGSN